MFHLKLIKGKSYWGIVCASESKPDVYVPEKAQADQLLKSGFFMLVDNPGKEMEKASAKEMAVDTDEDTGEMFAGEDETSSEDSVITELQRKSKAELVTYAEQNGIDITGCKTKDNIFQKVIEAIARADEARAALRE